MSLLLRLHAVRSSLIGSLLIPSSTLPAGPANHSSRTTAAAFAPEPLLPLPIAEQHVGALCRTPARKPLGLHDGNSLLAGTPQQVSQKGPPPKSASKLLAPTPILAATPTRDFRSSNIPRPSPGGVSSASLSFLHSAARLRLTLFGQNYLFGCNCSTCNLL